jgi:hypothetical protein
MRDERAESFAERQKHVKHFWRKSVGVSRIVFSPAALGPLYGFEPARELFAQTLDVLERLAQVVKFIHEIDLRLKQDALVFQFGSLIQPLAQDAMPGRRRLIHATARPPLCGSFAAAQK